MDGTLLGTEQLHLECWDSVCRDSGITDARRIFLKTVGRNRVDTDEILRKELGDGFDIRHHRTQKNDLFLKRIREGIPLKEGVVDSLSYLREKQIPMVVASSSNIAHVREHLQLAGIDEYFTAFVGGDQVSLGKPHPEIFIRAAGELGIDPSQTLAVEDSPNGVLSAHAAGSKVLLVPDLVEPNDEIVLRAAYVRRSLTEALELFRLLFP